MTATMSFQYPPPVGGADMDMSQPPYLPYSVPSQQPPAGVADPRTSQLSMHDSRELGLRRSFSTPNAMPYPGQGLDQGQSGLSGEKKRNKLGYHRSSVACVHCRKRKIRCVADPNDKQGRCTNCMRLKKECSFHPVDQPSPVDARGKSSSRVVGTGSQQNPSASASPATSSGHPSETAAKRPLSRQILPPGIGHPIASSQDDDDRASLSDTASNGRLAGQSFELSSQASMSWGSTDMQPSMPGRPGDFGGQWPPTTGLSDQFSPYDGMPASPGWQSDAHGQAAPEAFPWAGMPVPARSMSYSGDAMPGHPQEHFDATTQGVLYDRRASNFAGVYNPSLAGPLPNVNQSGPQILDSSRAFGSGNPPQTPIMWDSHTGQSQTPGSLHRPDQYDTWSYGPGTNGHH